MIGLDKISPLNTSFLVLACLVSVLACPALLWAQDMGKTQIQLVDGRTFEATITSVDEQGRIQGEGVAEGVNIQDVLSIATDRSVTKSNGVLLVPAGGGQIVLSQLAIADEVVKVRAAMLGELELPLQSLRAVVWSDSEIVKKAIASPSKDNDKVIVAVKDGERVVEGILESVDAEFVSVNYQGKSRKIALSKVKAIVIADLELKDPAGASASISLSDGSSVSGAIKSLANGRLEMSLAGGADIGISVSNVVRVNIVSDRLMFLSDLEPSVVQEKSLFAIQLPWQKNLSVEKNPLRLRGASSAKSLEFKKGLGVQSFSQLTFANSRGFDRFAATIGIDVETGGRGDCVMVVQGDGIELWSKRVKATDQAEAIEVDITGMKEINLIVHPGEDFDLGDHADWAEARFVKTK